LITAKNEDPALRRGFLFPRKKIIHPHLSPLPLKVMGSFPLLHFLLPPGEENRGKVFF
jgi:hypothetical protein